jgi:serine/threonine-protein kinase
METVMVDDGGGDSDNARVERLLEQILESGQSPEEACRPFPELLPQVRDSLRRLRHFEEQVSALFPPSHHSATQPANLLAPPDLPEVEGYEVEGILGRGGMGVVYRARHLRLNRPVALKMILDGSLALPSQRQGFLREAEAIAKINHPNIVQVFDAGESQDCPWFTMELVDGGNLAGKINGVPQAMRESARLIAHIADAIAVAHRHGIIHRDLKPGNILLTDDGTPKVTDFGLAQWVNDAEATLHNPAGGTPSYMAPEQARGATREIGPATDVYALGAILYELLTGRAPFRAESSTATLQMVLHEETIPPARLNPRVPRDLQTICLKCLEKEKSRRYAGAAELAEDLRHFDRGEPIVARAPGRVERLIMWTRRRPVHAAFFATATAALLLALTLGGIALHLSGQRQAAARAAEEDLDEADRLLQQSDLARARRSLDRAEGHIAHGGGPPAALKQRIAEREGLLALLQRLDAIRLERAIASDGHFRRRETDQEYERAFNAAGFAMFRVSPKELAEQINRTPARLALIAALDDWALCSAQDKVRRAWVMGTARLADPNPWRDEVRDPLKFWDADHIKEVARKAPMEGESIALLAGLGERLMFVDKSRAIPFLTRVQQQHPDGFYANFHLGRALYPDPISIAYLQAAASLRPDSAAPLAYVGVLLRNQGHPQEALSYLERAIRLDPQASEPRVWLASTLANLGRTEEAIDQYRQALRDNDDQVDWARTAFGELLQQTGRLDEAAEEYRKAIKADPRATWPRYNLAETLSKLNRTSEAIEQLQQLLAIKPDDAPTQFLLSQLMLDQGHVPEARAAWRKCLETYPDDHKYWFGYAELCLWLGDTEEYGRNRLALLMNFGGSDDPRVCERTAKSCLFLPWERYELEQAAALADRAEAADRTGHPETRPYDLFCRGLAAYRLGQFDKAIDLMRGDAASVTPPCPKLIVAMALYQKGEHDSARKTLAEAVNSFDWNQHIAPNGREEAWAAHILRREAESMIQPQQRPTTAPGSH